jgi:hypothetical protein
MTFTNGVTLAVQLLAMMIGGVGGIVFLLSLLCVIFCNDRPDQTDLDQ